MNKYIIELLKLESTVIIPNFGALMKSGKSLIFNSILKYNDQKLEKFIAEQENMDLQDVSNALAKYVREITAVIEKGEEFLIVGVGSFYKSDSGKIALKVIENEESTVVNKPITDEPKKENIVTSLYKEKPVKKDEKDSPTLTENDLIQSVSTKKTIKEEPVEVPQTPVDKKETPAQPEKKPEIVKEEVKKVEKTKPVKEKKVKPVKEKKKKKGLFWLFLLLLILIGGGIYVGLNIEKVKTLMVLNKTEEATEENTIDEELTEDVNLNETDPEEELMVTDSNEFVEETNPDEVFSEDDLVNTEEVLIEEKTEEVKETPKTVNKSLSFHVVVGAFGSESNAIGLVEKMKKEGFTSAKILGKFGSLYKVAASSHATKEEAIIGLEKAKSINKDAFVDKVNL